MLVYARCEAHKQNRRIPWKLYIVPFGLAISTGLFLAACYLTFPEFGEKNRGLESNLKLAFWVTGFIVEIIANIWVTRFEKRTPQAETQSQDGPPRASTAPPTELESATSGTATHGFLLPRPKFSLRSRLETIMIIILGEVRLVQLVLYRC